MKAAPIKEVVIRKITDSRGKWTVEADVIAGQGFGRAAAPSGASVGKNEVVAFVNGDVDKTISEIKKRVLPSLIGLDAAAQDKIDSLLKKIDGTKNFSRIGGNAAVAVSLVCAKAAAKANGTAFYRYLNEHVGKSASLGIPYPLGNVIGGGVHASGGTDIQEFLVIPVGARNIIDAVKANAAVHSRVKQILLEKGKLAGKGDEGAWAARVKNEEALDIIAKEVEKEEKEAGVKIRLGMDAAASELWNVKKRKYVYKSENKEITREKQIEYIEKLIKEYSLYYVEDPFEQGDFEGFAELSRLSKNCLICGDDLYTTNAERIRKGIAAKSTNAVLIKFNQIGTLTDTYKAIKLARESRQTPVISHRSGETEDNAIAHLAVGFGCPIIKCGIVGSERTAKLNELIRISEEDKNIKMAKLVKF